MEVFQRPSIEEPEVACIENSNDLRTPFYKYLTTGELPVDPKEAKKIKFRRARFTIIDGMLYKRAHTMPLLKCLGPQETNYVLTEVHSGVCGEHLGGRALAAKILRAGFSGPHYNMTLKQRSKSVINVRGMPRFILLRYRNYNPHSSPFPSLNGAWIFSAHFHKLQGKGNSFWWQRIILPNGLKPKP